jgi:CubicO group peptidase (beta-lactamase class C family)
MSSGLAWNEAVSYADTTNDERRMNRSTDQVRFILSRPLESPPGTVFNYSGGSPQLLAAAVQRAAGRPLLAYARDVLFEPLGITDVEWVHDSSDVPSAASGLRMRPVDVAKFGALYLNQGRWQGRQVIPASWVEATRTRQIELPAAESDSGRHGYSLLWWHSRLKTSGGDVEVLNASGNGGQNIFVVPRFGMVVTIFGGRYDAGDFVTEDILVDHIVPSLR